MKTLKISNQVLFWYFAVLASLNIIGVVLIALASFLPKTAGFVGGTIQNVFFGFILNFSASTPLVISVLLAIIYSLLMILKNKTHKLFSLSLIFGLVGALSAWSAVFIQIQNIWTALIMIIIMFGSYITAVVTGLVIVYKEIVKLQGVVEEDKTGVRVIGKIVLLIKKLLRRK